MKDTISEEGILLRMERLRQGKEQKEICTGICSVSTLSKIETGKQKADPVDAGVAVSGAGHHVSV